MAQLPDIYLDNDYEVEKKITQKNATTGNTEAATGLTGITCRISATQGGAAIHADLSVGVTERGSTGIYSNVFDGDDIRTHLAASVNTRVWFVFGDGVNIELDDDWATVREFRSS